MSSVLDPNAGPSEKVAEGGILFDDTVTVTSAVLSKTVVPHWSSIGLTIRIHCSQNGNFVVNYIGANGQTYTLQGSTAYTANSLVSLNFTGYARQAFVSFTPSAQPAVLYIEGWGYGRGS